MDARLEALAALLRVRESINDEIARIIDRPALTGHIGEWIAGQVFCIDLEKAANHKGSDGRFRSGELRDKTVNIKLYGRREGILDTTDDADLDYYLVLTGPKSIGATSVGGTRPLVIDGVYLFDARKLRQQMKDAGLNVGVTMQRHG